MLRSISKRPRPWAFAPVHLRRAALTPRILARPRPPISLVGRLRVVKVALRYKQSSKAARRLVLSELTRLLVCSWR